VRAARPGSSGVEGTLATVPSHATTSVKVPTRIGPHPHWPDGIDRAPSPAPYRLATTVFDGADQPLEPAAFAACTVA
jgi:hypothetical protein